MYPIATANVAVAFVVVLVVAVAATANILLPHVDFEAVESYAITLVPGMEPGADGQERHCDNETIKMNITYVSMHPQDKTAMSLSAVDQSAHAVFHITPHLKHSLHVTVYCVSIGTQSSERLSSYGGYFVQSVYKYYARVQRFVLFRPLSEVSQTVTIVFSSHT